LGQQYPDFIVKTTEGKVFIVETKGREDLDVPLKMARLKQWCVDINKAQDTTTYDFVFVDQAGFEGDKLRNFAELVASFREYKDR